MDGVGGIRAQFPILERRVKNDKPLVYFDNAASKQKPRMVLDFMQDCYTRYYANVHRGAHTLSGEATDAFEVARGKVARFINAKYDHEVIFTCGTTDSINLVAASFGLKPGDVVLLSHLEHHSNIVPWQLQEGVEIRVVPLLDDGRIDLDAYETMLDGVTLVALSHASNALSSSVRRSFH